MIIESSQPVQEDAVQIDTQSLGVLKTVAAGELTNAKVVVAKIGISALIAVGPSFRPHAEIINQSSVELLGRTVAIETGVRCWAPEQNVIIQGGLLQYLPGERLVLYGNSSFAELSAKMIFPVPTTEAATRILNRMILDLQKSQSPTPDLGDFAFGTSEDYRS